MRTLFLLTGNVAIRQSPTLITTVLGSCVSVCLWDRRLEYGGINHFKAATVPPGKKASARYGEVAMKELLEGMLKLGSQRRDLRAMLFGGGNVIPVRFEDYSIGLENVDFARNFLKRERIRLSLVHAGEDFGRRVTFDTRDGSVNVFRVGHCACQSPA